MPEIVGMGEELGRLGLLERLSPADAERGLANHPALISAVRDKKYERVMGIGDDFIPEFDLYNAVGAIYPLLDRTQRDEALRAHLRQFDRVNFSHVQSNHTPHIREPLLLADIGIANHHYWPGLQEDIHLLKKPSFAEVQREIMGENGLFDPRKVKSDFLIAYALMRNDFSQFGGDYVRIANPQFLDRVMRGIVALKFGRVSGEEIGQGLERLHELLPESVHNRIEPLMQEADWTSVKGH